MLRRLPRFFSTPEPGFAYSWGDSYHQMLGQSNTADPVRSPTRLSLRTRIFIGVNDPPFAVPPIRLPVVEDLTDRFTKAITGPFHSALISEKGELYTFGENDYGKLGHKRPNYWIPTKLAFGFQKIVDAACGYDFTLAVSEHGTVYSWGYGGECITFWKAIFYQERPGALGQGDYVNYSVPTPIEALKDVKIVEVQAGYEHAVARSKDGEVYVWGNNECGGVGLAGIADLPLPRKLAFPCAVKQISAARNFSTALLVNGDVYVWGENSHGQLPCKSEVVSVPTKVAEGVLNIEAGECSLILVDEAGLTVSGFERLTSRRFDLPARVTSLCSGDEFFAVALSNGWVYHFGGMFESPNPNSFLFLKRPTELKQVDRAFFPTRVIGLYGKYSYHIALLEASALMPNDE